MENPIPGIGVISEVVERYRPSAQTVELVRQTPLVFTVGISGAGKDSIQQKLFQSNKYRKLVAHTTRALRYNHGVLERNGIDYYFIDIAEAWRLLQEGGYVEANIYGGNIYGTSAAEIERIKSEGKIGLGDVDVNGVAKYVSWSKNVKPIFIVPPNFDVWQRRFMQRYVGGALDPRDFKARMQTAEAEISHALAVDYFYFVVNDKLDEAARQVDDIAQSSVSPQDFIEGREAARHLLDELRHHSQAL